MYYVYKKEAFMKRRNFLIASSLVASTSFIEATDNKFISKFNSVRDIIEALSLHFFPPKSSISSAKDMKITQFLFETMSHQSFDKDIKDYVIEGAIDLDKRTKGKFITMNYKDKERVLREYEKTSFGSSWLSRMLRLMIEGMFCDPIYGSNVGEGGWKSINSYGAYPRPKNRYIGIKNV